MYKEIIVTNKSPNKEYFNVIEKISITVEANVNATIILKYKGKKATVNVELYDNATLKLVNFGELSEQINEVYQLDNDANLEVISFYNSNNHKINTNIYLNGRNTEVNTNALSIVNKEEKVKRTINIIHSSQNSISRMNEVGLVSNKGYLSVDGIATIKEKMAHSDSSQKLKGIMLSKEAVIKMNPTLYIDNFDVLAGHGAAIGSINEDALFYLMSRGINKIDATKLIIKGTIDKLIENLDDVEKNEVMSGVEELL